MSLPGILGLQAGEDVNLGLTHPIAQQGFGYDMEALKGCDRLVLVLPCGRSAHLELGYAIGAGKETFILFPAEPQEPELMYCAADHLCLSLAELLVLLRIREAP